MQMDDLLKGLGPKENPLVTSGGRLTPSAKLEGASPAAHVAFLLPYNGRAPMSC